MGLVAVALSLASAYLFLARRGVLRWVSLAVFVLTPLAVIAVYAFYALLWVAPCRPPGGCWRPRPRGWRWQATEKSGGCPSTGAAARRPAVPDHESEIRQRQGGRFGLQPKAAALGAEVFLMSGPEAVDVAAVARAAVASGADLLGVAGGDGTQALVAEVAAEHGLPFLVITAGTRNHFALDLGLDRDDPAACLAALSDGVDLLVDLGVIGGRVFVNNASFGAYAEIVETPAYRGDKLGTTLEVLPSLLQGHRGARLAARADEAEITAPQALLVSNNQYGSADVAGLNRRVRLDGGVLGVVGVTVSSANEAVRLLRGSRSGGLTMLTAKEVTVTADTARIPVGVDGEAVSLPTPVLCGIRPRALRVRVPRNRPGATPPEPPVNFSRLRRLACWPFWQGGGAG